MKVVTRAGQLLSPGPEGIGDYCWDAERIPYIYGNLRVGERIHVHNYDTGFMEVYTVVRNPDYVPEQDENGNVSVAFLVSSALELGLVKLQASHVINMESGTVSWEDT